MTKDEMLELLGDMDPQYILEGQRLRSGQMHTRNKGSWLRRATAVAAMLAMVTVAGALLPAGVVGTSKLPRCNTPLSVDISQVKS